MRRLLLTLALIAPISARAQSGYTCLPASEGSEFVRSALNKTVSRTDSLSARARATLHLPAGDSSIVQPVTDQVVCAQAGAAVATIFPAAQGSAGAWVYQIGADRYYVLDPQATKAHRMWGVVLDQSFTVLASDPVN